MVASDAAALVAANTAQMLEIAVRGDASRPEPALPGRSADGAAGTGLARPATPERPLRPPWSPASGTPSWSGAGGA